MALSRRILQNVPGRLSVPLVDFNGQPRNATGAVTVTGRRASGAVLFDSRPAEVEPGGLASVALSADETAVLDSLTLTWVEEGGGTYETVADVVGGFYFSLDEARYAAPGFTDTSKYPNELMADVRQEVEEELERITGRAFVPRYRRVVLNSGTLIRPPDVDVRKIRSLNFDGRNVATSVGLDGTLYMLSASQIANAAEEYSSGLPQYQAVIEYEYGLSSPPADLKRAALIRMVSRLGLSKSGVPDRNEYQLVDGQLFTVTQPGVRGSLTGIREVDAVYSSYSVATEVMAVPIR